MSNAGDKPSQESSAQGTSDNSAPAEQRSGRIAYDERGNSVWEWQLETGVYSRDISTQRLKKLDLNDLSIAETGLHPLPTGLAEPGAASGKHAAGGGSNPYDNSSTGGGKVANDPYNSAGRGALKTGQRGSNSPLPRKPVDPNKMQEWLELRKRVERLEREDGDD